MWIVSKFSRLSFLLLWTYGTLERPPPLSPCLYVGVIHITNVGDPVHVKHFRANNSEDVTYFIGSVAYQQENFNLDKQTTQVTLTLPFLLEISTQVIPC